MKYTTLFALSSFFFAGASAVNCDGVQQWLASFSYVTGNQVIFNNGLFTAKQFSFNNAPPTHPDQWTSNGTCSPPINNSVSCTGVTPWTSTVGFTKGSQVTFGGHLWTAVQFTQANQPGDASGSWRDDGACK